MAGKRKIDFDSFYRDIYPNRWDSLSGALKEEQCYEAYNKNLLKTYFLDPASVRVAKTLQAENGMSILDLCAAPGGKSLVIASRMNDKARLTANDRSSARRARLKKVLDEHLPGHIRERITVTGHDASKWGLYERNAYDRVLLDAPCSSERHIIQSEKHLGKWTPARTKHLGIQAFAMLASAFDALAPGGRLVYSTCTISPGENEGVVEKLLKKRPGAVLLPVDIQEEEEASVGYRLWPDRQHKWGPIFYALISKSITSTQE